MKNASTLSILYFHLNKNTKSMHKSLYNTMKNNIICITKVSFTIKLIEIWHNIIRNDRTETYKLKSSKYNKPT